MQRPDNTIVFGMTGSGKSAKVVNLVKDMDRVLFFDTLGHDYKDGVIFDNIDDLKEFWIKVYRSSFRIIYRPSIDMVTELGIICDLAFLCGDMWLVVEELAMSCKPNNTPAEIGQIFLRGRHRDIHFVGVSQRPHGIDRDITAMATTAYIFKTEEPRDVDYLKERFGIEVAEKLANLEEYQYVKWSADGVTVGKDELVSEKNNFSLDKPDSVRVVSKPQT